MGNWSFNEAFNYRRPVEYDAAGWDWEMCHQDAAEVQAVLDEPTQIELEQMVASFARGEGIDPIACTRQEIDWPDFNFRDRNEGWLREQREKEAERERQRHLEVVLFNVDEMQARYYAEQLEQARAKEHPNAEWRAKFDRLQWLRARHGLRDPLPASQEDRVRRLGSLRHVLGHHAHQMDANQREMYTLEEQLLGALTHA